MTVLDILKGARQCLNDPKRWTKRTIARFGNMHQANNPLDPRVACVCMDGALQVATEKLGGLQNNRAVYYAAYHALGQSLPRDEQGIPWNVEGYNDQRTTTHADVLRVLDAAIAAEQVKPTMVDR